MTTRVLHASDSYVAADTPAVEGLERAVDRALTAGVDAVVHTGPVFRRPSPDEADLAAVAATLEPLADADIPVYAVAGERTADADPHPLDLLAERAPVERLGADPVAVGDDVRLWGIDYRPGELEDDLGALRESEGYTYNLLCLHRALTPPMTPYDATWQPYELTRASAVFLNEVLAGGSDDARSWSADDYDYTVSYPGSTNPELGDEPGDRPTVALLEVFSPEEAERTVLDLSPKTARDEVGDSGTADRDADGPAVGETTDDEPVEGADPAAEPGDPATNAAVEAEMEPLLDLLDYDDAPLDGADTETLADLYGLLSKAKSLLDDRRKEVGAAIETRVGPDEEVTGRYATVRRTASTRRSARDTETVFEVLDREGIDRSAVLDLDTSKLRDVVDDGDVPEDAVFETTERTYVRRQDLSLEE